MILLAIKASLIVLVTLCAVYLLPRQSPATRHMLLTTGLICALVVPFIAVVLPEWHAVGLPDYAHDANRIQVTPLTNPQPVSGLFDRRPASQPQSPRTTVFWIWLTGLVMTGAALLAGVARVEWLVLGSEPLTSGQFADTAAKVSVALNLRRPIRLLQNQSTVLGTWGVFRPQVLLPRDAKQWSGERLRIVLTHELAHVKRLDWLVQMLAEYARVVYWFNPLFWLLCRRLRHESEHACDDVVLNLGTDAGQYAAHLLDIARAMKNSERAWTPVVAMAQSPNLERRFLAMLNPLLNHGRTTRKSLFAAFIAAICLTLPLAAMRAREQAPARVWTSTAGVLPLAATPAVAAPKSARPTARSAQPRSSLAAKPVAAQPEFGGLSGTVYDPSGAVVAGASLTATNLQTKESQQTTADQAGEFEFAHLQAGEYEYLAARPGFRLFRSRVTIQANENLKKNVTLLLGNIIQQVTVTASGQPNSTTLLPPGTPRRIRVGGNVQAAKLIAQVKPVYPPSAQNTGVEGTVLLEGVIGTDGAFNSIRVLSSIDTDLTAAAEEAVRQWRYQPTLLNGVPVEVLTTISVDFKLTP